MLLFYLQPEYKFMRLETWRGCRLGYVCGVMCHEWSIQRAQAGKWTHLGMRKGLPWRRQAKIWVYFIRKRREDYQRERETDREAWKRHCVSVKRLSPGGHSWLKPTALSTIWNVPSMQWRGFHGNLLNSFKTCFYFNF